MDNRCAPKNKRKIKLVNPHTGKPSNEPSAIKSNTWINSIALNIHTKELLFLKQGPEKIEIVSVEYMTPKNTVKYLEKHPDLKLIFANDLRDPEIKKALAEKKITAQSKQFYSKYQHENSNQSIQIFDVSPDTRKVKKRKLNHLEIETANTLVAFSEKVFNKPFQFFPPVTQKPDNNIQQSQTVRMKRTRPWD